MSKTEQMGKTEQIKKVKKETEDLLGEFEALKDRAAALAQSCSTNGFARESGAA